MKSLSTPIFSVLAAITAVIAPISAVQAQENVFVAPKALTQDGRFMPGFGNEAIVKTRFTVKADGTIADVEILGGFSNQFLETTLRQSIAKWTYTPGTVNGEAADFYNQEYTVAVRIYPGAPAPAPGRPGAKPAADAPVFDASAQPPIELQLSPGIREEIDRITAIIAGKDYETALKELDKLLKRVRSVLDYSLTQEMISSVLMADEQPYAALEATKLSTMHTQNPHGEEEWFLTPELLQNALRKQFLLATSLRQNALAWDTYSLLISKFDIPADEKIHEQAKAVKEQLDSPEPLALLTKITDKEWTYTPSRRIFTVTNVEGKLNNINARCERKNLKLKYQDGVDWTLPEALGKCQLDFEGKEGTSFAIYEFSE